MEPFGYLDMPLNKTENDLSKHELKHYAHLIAQRYEQRILICLFKENRENPFRKKFKVVFSISILLLIGSVALLMVSGLIHGSTGQPKWYVYVGFGAMFAASLFSYLCRVILQNYIQSVIEKYYHSVKRPVSGAV